MNQKLYSSKLKSNNKIVL